MNTRPEPQSALYQEGFQFRVLDPQHQGQTMPVILSYCYHNGDTYRYHMGLVLGNVGDPVPHMYKHCKLADNGSVQWVDYTTVDESEVTAFKLPDDLSAARFYLRSHSNENWVWERDGGWTISLTYAKVFSWDEMCGFPKPTSSYFQPISEA